MRDELLKEYLYKKDDDKHCNALNYLLLCIFYK